MRTHLTALTTCLAALVTLATLGTGCIPKQTTDGPGPFDNLVLPNGDHVALCDDGGYVGAIGGAPVRGHYEVDAANSDTFHLTPTASAPGTATAPMTISPADGWTDTTPDEAACATSATSR